MKLTTKLLKELIKEELNKMSEGRASYTGPSHDDNPYKIIDIGLGWSIAVDSRQESGSRALNDDYSKVKELIDASLKKGGQTMADVQDKDGKWTIGPYWGRH